jgi:signal transduction histidine kinase
VTSSWPLPHDDQVVRRPPSQLSRSRLVHFPNLETLLGRLESRQGERRATDRRSARGGFLRTSPELQAPLGARELCHDMRQPLAAVNAVLAELDDSPTLSAGDHQRLTQVSQELERVSHMITGVLVASPSEPVDLGGVVREAADSVGLAFQGRLEVVISGRAVVCGDPLLLHRAFANLLDNACGVVGPGGFVRVAVWCGADRVHVDVDDSGRAPHQPPSSSYGMGLLIVQGVVARHGGEVRAGSNELGGTRVSIQLPLEVCAPVPGASR